MRGFAFTSAARCSMRHSSITIIFILWLSGLVAAAQYAKVGLVLPELGTMYPTAETSLGFLVSSISFVGALLGLFAGVMAAKIGLRKLLLVGLVLGSVVSLLQSMGLPIWLLLASRVVEGFSHLAIVVAAPTLIALNSSKRARAAAMTLWSSFFGVSFALTGWFGLPLVAIHGVNTLFFTHGALMVAVTLLAVLVLPVHKESGGDVVVSEAMLSTIIRRHRDAWSSPFISAPAAGWLFYTLTFVALLAVLPGMMPPADRGFTVTILPLASLLSSMTLGMLLLQRLSAVFVVKIGLVAAICSAITFAFLPDAIWPPIALFAALGLVQGATFASVPQLNPSSNHQALANGAVAQAGNLGNALGTPFLLMLQGIGGLNAVITMVVLSYITAICVHLMLAKRRKSYHSRSI